ncbi:MAG: hypothetical protein K0U98_09190 [Deltaproteobacteria bacterium]|nr:hypothetical protein [Deltaproteobacteria bacterium]
MSSSSCCLPSPGEAALLEPASYRSSQLLHLLASQKNRKASSALAALASEPASVEGGAEVSSSASSSPGGFASGGPLTTPEAVRSIVENPNPVLRNVQITQSYHELTLAMEPLLGGADRSWCVFATWASKQAGCFIRGDVIPSPLRRFLGLEGRRSWRGAWRVRWWLRSAPFLSYLRVTAQDVSSHVADGNHLVYAKMAPLFARFLELFAGKKEPDANDVKVFLGSLEGESATGEVLQGAFRSLCRAVSEPDSKLRAERVLLANLLIGLHEQMRLQLAISGALRAPIQQALEGPHRLFPHWPVPGFLRHFLAGSFRRLFAAPIRRFEEEFRQVATQCLLTLGLPEGELSLGDDLPPLEHGEAFPESLRELTLGELKKVVSELDRTPGTLEGSGARDWTLLADRMNYVADYFRSRQQEESHLQPPFTPEQARAIARGEMPSGAL